MKAENMRAQDKKYVFDIMRNLELLKMIIVCLLERGLSIDFDINV